VGLSVTNEFPDLQLPPALDVNGGAALHKLATTLRSKNEKPKQHTFAYVTLWRH
jgi:hypothetical protein